MAHVITQDNLQTMRETGEAVAHAGFALDDNVFSDGLAKTAAGVMRRAIDHHHTVEAAEILMRAFLDAAWIARRRYAAAGRGVA